MSKCSDWASIFSFTNHEIERIGVGGAEVKNCKHVSGMIGIEIGTERVETHWVHRCLRTCGRFWGGRRIDRFLRQL
jgi:hypothetical protein